MMAFPTPQVVYVTPKQQDVTSYVEQTGTTQAVARVELRPRVSGYLLERKFEDGDLVTKDQLLFVIDEEPFQARLKLAEAKLDEAQASLEKAQQSKAREIAESQLKLSETELKLAQINHDRATTLVGKNALSRQEYDEAEAALRKAQAQIVASRSQLDQALADHQTNLLTAQAAVKLATAEVDTATIDLGYCRITAPIAGRIDRRTLDVGNFVAATSPTVLASIVTVDSVYAYAAISESDLVEIKTHHPKLADGKGIPIEMSLGEDRSFPFAGEIDYIAPSVEASTGTVQIRGRFKNNGVLMPGMFVRVRVSSGTAEKALLVPERAIGFDQVGYYVYAVKRKPVTQKDATGADVQVEADVVERRNIVPGDLIDGLRVITGPVAAADQIVSDGLLKIRPEMVVVPKSAAELEAQTKPEVAQSEGKH